MVEMYSILLCYIYFIHTATKKSTSTATPKPCFVCLQNAGPRGYHQYSSPYCWTEIVGYHVFLKKIFLPVSFVLRLISIVKI